MSFHYVISKAINTCRAFFSQALRNYIYVNCQNCWQLASVSFFCPE